MTSTDLATIPAGTVPALNRPLDDIRMIIEENLVGQEINEFDLLRVKMPSGGATRWDIPNPDGTETAGDTLTGVLVFHKRTRSYWPSREANGTPPICRGERQTVQLNGRSGLMMWGVGQPGGNCKLCPYSQFGSSLDPQSEGQACKEKEIWFLLPPNVDSFLPMVVALPATSLSTAMKYRTNVGKPLSSVITELTLVADKNTRGQKFSKIVPTVGGLLIPEEAQKAREYAQLMRPLFDRTASDIGAMTDTYEPHAMNPNGTDPDPGSPPAGEQDMVARAREAFGDEPAH